MDTQILNSNVAKFLLALQLVIYLVGVPIADMISELLGQEHADQLPFTQLLLLGNLKMGFDNLVGFLVALWLFITVPRLNYNKWVWCFLGLTYGSFSLLLLLGYYLYDLNRANNPTGQYSISSIFFW